MLHHATVGGRVEKGGGRGGGGVKAVLHEAEAEAGGGVGREEETGWLVGREERGKLRRGGKDEGKGWL